MNYFPKNKEMEAREDTSCILSLAYKMKARYLMVYVLTLFLISGFSVQAQTPVLKVKFGNPSYDCSTHIYKVNVRFQSNTPNLELFGINVRFFYPDDILEFISFGEFASGYAAVSPNPPLISTGNSSSGMGMFTFPGPSEYVNGAVQKVSATPVTHISTTGWTKLFCVSFQVEDTASFNIGSFCPSIIWDLEEDPADGGFFGGSDGVVMTVVTTYPNSGPSTENVQQLNWQYDGIPGLPFGFPNNNWCINTICAYAPNTYLPTCDVDTPGVFNIPVSVVDFDHIGAFSLAFKYDPNVMTYLNNTPNPVFNTTNGLLTVTDSVCSDGLNKITLNHQGTHAISLTDSSSLSNLSFNFISGMTDLTWQTEGNFCYYSDSNNIPVYDLPLSDYYIDGQLFSLMAPTTKIDSVVAVAGDLVTYAVRVWDYTDIQSGTLTLTYNPEVILYYAILPHAAIADTFNINTAVQGTLEMSWTGPDTDLPDESALMYITFQYLGGSTPLSWFDNGLSCHYTSCNSNDPLSDEPLEDHYIGGSITNSVYVWGGENSGDWDADSNWIYNVAPEQFTNVIIDPAADPSYWPTFNGDFTMGEDCKNLTINGNAQFTINGDFIINPGHTLTLNGNGTLQVSGDWINSGIFIPGTGAVEFIGSSTGTIDQGVPPGNYVAAYIRSTFSSTMVPLAGGITGPTGNDAHSDVNIGFDFHYLGGDYSQVRLNTNGWLSLNLSGADEYSSDNTLLFNTSSPTTVLAPWWDDLLADASTTISYLTEGTAPSRVFIAEWKDILAYSSNATARLNFQVKLYESSGIIEFYYGDLLSGTHSISESASIGIKDATGGLGNFIEATQNSIHIILAVLNSSISWPSVNYRFSPPVVDNLDIFYKIIVSKSSGNLNIARDVKVSGLE